MHILAIILSAWSYRQNLTDSYLRSLGGLLIREREAPPRLSVAPDGQLSLVKGETGLMAPDEVEAIRNRSRDYSAGPPRPNPNGSNEIIGSHFASTRITHNGTDAWYALKSRLAENGIVIDDDHVAELSAGFFAERKFQELTGRTDKGRLRDEIIGDYIDPESGDMRFDARWVREIQAHPDEEEIAAECYAELEKNFPKALGVTVLDGNTAIGFDPNTLEVE